MSTYGDHIADIYDEPGQTPEDADEAAAFLWDLASSAAGAERPQAMELGIGTGRVALPLAAKGCEVSGVDCSQAMLERCRAADTEGRLRLVHGDMTTARFGERRFHVVYAVFNTLLHLLTQDEQVAAFGNAAAQLAPGGAFVVQVSTPDSALLHNGQHVRLFEVERDYVDLNVTIHDPVRQHLRTQQMFFKSDGIQMRPLLQRYVWPSELDLMARIAGLRQAARYADWTGAGFTGASTEHVSVYRPAEAG
ncbi:class I SAM-dependent methyltransferase [Nonomuraea sp. H19]|uniref:class I SAM-dependent methyltransferase n=1 Tax=Nonomuraea sp. H19 TaxID=3452206 RepID=UPI003F8B86FB